MSEPAAGDERVRIRWVVVVVLAVAGLLCIAGGWLLGVDNYWSGVAVNVGTSLFLAGFLVVLERVIVGRIRTVAARTATTAAAAAVEEAERHFTTQLDDLRAELAAREKTNRDATDQTIRSLGDGVSFDNLKNAMKSARENGAIANRFYVADAKIIVAAGAGENPPRLYLEYVPDIDIDGEAVEFESIRIQLLGDGIASAHAPVIWTQDDDPADVFEKVKTQAVKNSLGRAARDLDVEVFYENLKLGLADALAARRADEGAWQSGGELLEILTADRVITRNGVEVRGYGIAIELSSAPRYPGDRRTILTPPQGFETNDWFELYRRAEAYAED